MRNKSLPQQVTIAAFCAFAIAGSLPVAQAFASEPAPTLTYRPASGEDLSEEDLASYNEFLAGLSPLQGAIELTKANAVIDVPASHYFLETEAARNVLENAWGNPPDPDVLGMIFPASFTPIDDGAWGAIVYYRNDGYVSDEDAAKIDYDEMMRDFKKGQVDSNEWRTQNGYDPIDIVGWAERPHYDADTNKLYWARELKFGDAEINTLNYDIRVLGRRGALTMSFVANMDALDDVRRNAPTFLQMASFNPGATYAEYQPGVDKKAAYGIAGLIGGAALAKKTGLLAAILLFGKKFIVLIVAGIIGLFGAARKMLTGKS